MRGYVLRVLLWKEGLRHLANRGGIVLLVLLFVMTLLLSLFDRGGGMAAASAAIVSPIEYCFIDSESPEWSAYLKAHRTEELGPRLRFRELSKATTAPDGRLVYPSGIGAIQVRRLPDADGRPAWKVWVWYPQGGREAMAPFEEWFFATSRGYFRERAGLTPTDPAAVAGGPLEEAYRAFRERLLRESAAAGRAVDRVVPDLVLERTALDLGSVDLRAALAASLVLFALVIPSVYLLPSLTCEERERGVLLAQALSPASPGEILAAKFLFYPPLAVGLAALLAGVYNPAVLGRWFFWAAVAGLALGTAGIGLTIAAVARTQRAASMGAMCYLLTVVVLILICDLVGLPVLATLALEYHGPRMLQAVLNRATVAYAVDSRQLLHLLAAWTLAFVWCAVAIGQFRRRGWQ